MAAHGTGIQALLFQFSVNFSLFQLRVMILVTLLAIFLAIKRTYPMNFNYMIIIYLMFLSVMMKAVTPDQIRSIYLYSSNSHKFSW